MIVNPKKSNPVLVAQMKITKYKSNISKTDATKVK
jgi:hypothetical protein